MRQLYLVLLLGFNLYCSDPNPQIDQALEVAQVVQEESNQELTIEQKELIAAKAFVETLNLLLQIIPPDKLEELHEKFTKSVSNLERDRTPTAEELVQLEESVKGDIEEILKIVELEADKSLVSKLKQSWLVFRQNMSFKTFVKTSLYRVAASLDTLLMTYLFITHDITIEAAFKSTAFDIVVKFFLYYAYDRLWKAPWFNRLWKRTGAAFKKCCCCKSKKNTKAIIASHPTNTEEEHKEEIV